MRSQLAFAAIILGLVGCTQARTLKQQFSSASAVSVSGGSGPNGNCGATQTVGNAQAFASGPPCLSPIIPAPPPSTTCPATVTTVQWGAASSYPPLTLCPGSTVSYKWNTETSSKVFGLWQIPSGSCPGSASDKDVQLIVTPASSPNKQGFVNTNINSPGTYWFTDLANCNKGQLQKVTVQGTPATAGAAAQGQAVTTG